MIGLDVDLALLPEFEHSEKVEDTEKVSISWRRLWSTLREMSYLSSRQRDLV